MAQPYRCLVAPKSPPSTYPIAALLDGEQGAGWRVASLTVQRAFFIGTGLWLAGIRDRKLLVGSLTASATVTFWIMGAYLLKMD